MTRYGLLLSMVAVSFAQTPDARFFEEKIRPVLATKCYACHSSSLRAPMAGLALDTKDGMLKGGTTGPVLVPAKPGESRLLKALRYTDSTLQMPPSGKLADSVIADFERWIGAGAPDPRSAAPVSNAAPAPFKGMSIEEGRKWWAFQPVHEVAAPVTRTRSKNKIDSFVLAKLEAAQLKPSPAADARTLVTRAYIDLLGFKPSYEEVESFLADKSANAYEKLIDRLLASPHYGERWGRHWLDVARFAEDNPTSEATNPPYPYAWRYRDWVIESVNKDVPYDQFVKLQLAGDLMPGVERNDLRALAYLGAAPVYHKDQRLSAEVIGGFLSDDWDERVDAVSRGLLGMTVGCARCHDHKFDPITTKDYYGLAGVFASTMRAERPMFEIDSKIENRYLFVQNRLFDLRYSANLLTNEASTVVGAADRVAKWNAEIESLRQEMEGLRDRYPQLTQSLEKYWTSGPRQRPPVNPPAADGAAGAAAAPAPPARFRGRNLNSNEPFMNAVFEAAQYVDGSDHDYTFITYRPGEPRNVPVLLHGNVSTPGEVVPRKFLSVLSKGDETFKQGSGRLEFANRIFTDAAPLAARVIVNRVWAWHFGRALVPTLSDFGVQGERPTHPELLDDLSARFIAHGWSLKWLNREIMLSAAYQQSSHPRADGERIDQTNALLWRMNPRRMDIESYRDSLLRSAGRLSEKMYGPSEEADRDESVRRTAYSTVSRGRLSNLFRLYDFPDPVQTAPDRDVTTSSLQQLFVMNSSFIHTQAEALAVRVEGEADNAAKARALFRAVLARDPTATELDFAVTYLNHGTAERYAQVLLSTNEEIFWQ